VEFLLSSDHDGLRSQRVFQSLGDDPTAHVAEHLAVELLGRIIDQTPQPGADLSTDDAQRSSSKGGSKHSTQPFSPACASACRWAGLTGRWSMLAMVADQMRPITQAGDHVADPQRLAVDRLLAESLMQTRRSKDALAWWNAIIDVQGADDFATLLRGAEAAVAHGTVDLAVARLDQAKRAAGDDPFQLSLIQLLEAELAIRKARLDEARDLLSAIVRSGECAEQLRPRAQWLIGETYFLQSQYAEAIDAYRRVDVLDAEGEWAAAALLQAGKAFEKLLRSREAATCYTALLSRFGDSPHASQARTRLAQLGGDAANAPLRR
jgi:TolA-binding protein